MGSVLTIAGFSLSAPLTLLLGLAMPLLIFAYLKRERRIRLTVSSKLLYETLPKRPRARRRFKPPWQFWLELLALLALLLALAGPFRNEPAKKVAVVVDSSLSMQAETAGGKSHLDRCLELLADKLGTLDEETSFSLYRSTPGLSRIGNDSLQATELIPLISAEVFLASGDTLDTDIQTLHREGTFQEIIVLSDRSAGVKENYYKNGISLLQSDLRIANVFIRQLDFEESAQRSIIAHIGASSEEDIEVRFRLYSAAQLGAPEKLVQEEKLSVQPSNESRLRIPLDATEAKAYFYRAEITPVQPSGNGVLLDDVAWLASDSRGTTRILLIGYAENDSAGLSSLGGDSVQTISAQDYSLLAPGELENYDVLIFYGVTPRRIPTRPALFILPPAGSSYLPSKTEIENVTLSSWDTQHPLLRYLNVVLLKPSRAVLFDRPAWGQVILRSKQGPVAIAGSLDSNRMIAVGFELLPFEGRKTPASSILLLNALQWLGGSAKLTPSLQLGASIRLSKSSTWVIRPPSGTLETFPADTAREENYRFKEPGLYVVHSSNSAKQSETSVYTVGAYSLAESHTWRPPVLNLPQSPQLAAESQATQKVYWPFIAAIALALLLLQLVLCTSPWRERWT